MTKTTDKPKSVATPTPLPTFRVYFTTDELPDTTTMDVEAKNPDDAHKVVRGKHKSKNNRVVIHKTKLQSES
jgi:hypothetical protein